MGPKRLENRYITLQYIQISNPKKLNRNYGLFYKIRAETKHIRRNLYLGINVVSLAMLLNDIENECATMAFLNN